MRSGVTTDAALLPSGVAERGAVPRDHTPSAALDRITKRTPMLDGTAQRAATGRGVTIYVFDGGIQMEHPELRGRVRRGFDAFPGGPRVCNSHGTAVAGAAAGATLGVAPDAEVVDVKMISCSRQRGTVQAIVAASDWAIQDHQAHPDRPAVVNWSFIVDTVRSIPEIDSAVAKLRAAGMLVVTSAGNFDVNACAVSPANAPGALVAGASSLKRDRGPGRWRDERTPSTAWGPCVDVYAPGDSVLLPGYDDFGVSITMVWSGTSMSAGYVSGAAAALLEQHPHATPATLAELIKQRATVNVLADNTPVPTPLLSTRLLYIGPVSP